MYHTSREKEVWNLGREEGSEVDTHHCPQKSCHKKRIRQAHEKPAAA